VPPQALVLYRAPHNATQLNLHNGLQSHLERRKGSSERVRDLPRVSATGLGVASSFEHLSCVIDLLGGWLTLIFCDLLAPIPSAGLWGSEMGVKCSEEVALRPTLPLAEQISLHTIRSASPPCSSNAHWLLPPWNPWEQAMSQTTEHHEHSHFDIFAPTVPAPTAFYQVFVASVT
jgi:hypothetical protein